MEETERVSMESVVKRGLWENAGVAESVLHGMEDFSGRGNSPERGGNRRKEGGDYLGIIYVWELTSKKKKM